MAGQRCPSGRCATAVRRRELASAPSAAPATGLAAWRVNLLERSSLSDLDSFCKVVISQRRRPHLVEIRHHAPVNPGNCNVAPREFSGAGAIAHTDRLK